MAPSGSTRSTARRSVPVHPKLRSDAWCRMPEKVCGPVEQLFGRQPAAHSPFGSADPECDCAAIVYDLVSVTGSRSDVNHGLSRVLTGYTARFGTSGQLHVRLSAVDVFMRSVRLIDCPAVMILFESTPSAPKRDLRAIDMRPPKRGLPYPSPRATVQQSIRECPECLGLGKRRRCVLETFSRQQSRQSWFIPRGFTS